MPAGFKPSVGILDSGCGRTIIGRDTLAEFKQLWQRHGVPCPAPEPEINHLPFRNGHKDRSTEVIPMPVRIGIIRAAVIQSKAPLLISRIALQKLKAVLVFDKRQMSLFADRSTIPLRQHGWTICDQFRPRSCPMRGSDDIFT